MSPRPPLLLRVPVGQSTSKASMLRIGAKFAASQGLEPQYPPPKGGVLPLDELAMSTNFARVSSLEQAREEVLARQILRQMNMN